MKNRTTITIEIPGGHRLKVQVGESGMKYLTVEARGDKVCVAMSDTTIASLNHALNA